MRKILAISMLFVFILSVNAQDAAKDSAQEEDNSKYTVVNSMIRQVVQTSEGLIITYKVDRNFKTTYIPNRFFKEKIAMRIDENNSSVSPQMSVVLKDGKPYRVKLYLANNQSNLTYQYAEILSQNMRDKFKIEELQIEF